MTLCRRCHNNLHRGYWQLVRSKDGVKVIDSSTGKQVMRRLSKPDLDIPSILQLLNVAEHSLSQLFESLAYFSDEQLEEAYAYAGSLGKRSWLVQAAVLHEAQQRSIYGDNTLEAIARRFDISLRHAQKYALVWTVFFARQDETESVNIDAILLDEPSWYVVSVTETRQPEEWLAYAQDRKAADPRYSVAAFRRDIVIARINRGIGDTMEMRESEEDLPELKPSWACPWVKLLCVHTGRPIPFRQCEDCGFRENEFCETNPTASEV